MIFDTHVHYNLSPLYESWQKFWQEAQAESVKKSVIVGAGIGSSKRAVEIASQDDNLYAAIGKHPDNYNKAVRSLLQEGKSWEGVFEDIREDVGELRELLVGQEAARHGGDAVEGSSEILKPAHHGDDAMVQDDSCHSGLDPESPRINVVAIGEIGLDYFSLPQKGDRRKWSIEAQKVAFKVQLGLAAEFDLPVIVHVRDTWEAMQEYREGTAQWDTLQIIRQGAARHGGDAVEGSRIVLHCIAGSTEYVRAGLELGAYIGVDGNVTYKRSQKGDLPEIIDLVRLVPEDKLLLETDAPYLAPEPHKGETCHPKFIAITAAFLEQKLGISREQLYKNACEFFRVQ